MTGTGTAAVTAAFDALKRALASGNLEQFQSLCAADVPPQDAVFARNAKRLQAGAGELVLERVELVARVAHAHFALLERGRAVDRGVATFSLEPDGWRLRRL